MGYYISSVYAVSPNDTHAFFIYFIPSTRDEYGDSDEFTYLWINEWMDQHFQRIAESVGPHKGVIIAPSPKHDESYLESLLQVKARSKGEFFRSVYPSITGKPVDKSFLKEEEKLHWGYPVIIFSRTPLHEEMDKNEAVVIKLASCKDEKDLSKVIDVLLSVIRNDDMSKLEKLHQFLRPSTTEDHTKSAELIDALELKPNFFGVGINFNYLLKKLAEAILTRTKAT